MGTDSETERSRAEIYEDFAPAYGGRDTEFDVEKGDFGVLEVRDAGNETGFHYFYDTKGRRLITDFVMGNRAKVATLCQVTLIKKGAKYSPRLKLWKRDKTAPAKEQSRLQLHDTPTTRSIKALVDTEDCHDNFWKLINFLESFSDIDLPANKFRVLSADDLQLVDILKKSSKDTSKGETLAAIRAALGDLTEEDIQVLAGRKADLERFRRLLFEDGFAAAEQTRLNKARPEDLWQGFFERNQWIFGYGLNLISCEGVTDEKLQHVTTGANIFQGAGKRVDALLRTRGYLSSLLFVEIKTPSTTLLETNQYRPPDVYRPSKDLSGGVAQVQKTAHKAVRNIAGDLHRLYDSSGTPLGVEVSMIRPRQVLVIGNLRQFSEGSETNPEKSASFELFRRSITDVEVITFDELYQRAVYIIGRPSSSQVVGGS